ncbi:MAG: hypothetical protein R3D88_07970 [Alphaproteobacteria bacterium]|nr:hypothetical protein [Alphaproteobacteria bacterium]
MFKDFRLDKFENATESLFGFLKFSAILFAGSIVTILSLIAFIENENEANEFVKNLLSSIPVFVNGLGLSLLFMGLIIGFKFIEVFVTDKKVQILFCLISFILLLFMLFYIGYSQGSIEGIIDISGIKGCLK